MSGLSFDTKFSLAYISGRVTFDYHGFEWEIFDDGKRNIVLKSEYWDKGMPISYLFNRVTNDCSELHLQDCFRDFHRVDLIEFDIPYRVLSTLNMDFKYKLFLYSLVRHPRVELKNDLRYIKSEEGEIYDELEKYIRLYEDSPLLYEQEQQRIDKLRQKRLKKIKSKN